MKSKALQIVLTCFCALILTACSPNQYPANRIMVLSVSSDGNYAISSNSSKQAVLWSIKDKTYKIVSKDANIYSAYFIKNTNDFIYQDDKTNEVFVENTAGNIIKKFNPGFPTYGQAITSDLLIYISVDAEDQVFFIKDNQKKQLLYHYCGPNYTDEGSPPPNGLPSTCGSFMGDTKLFNLNLSEDNNYLLTSGFSEFYIWNLVDQKLLSHNTESANKTFAILSPNDKSILVGDEDLNGYIAPINFANSGYNFFIRLPVNQDITAYMNNGYENALTGLVSWKFIDQSHLVAFIDGIPDSFNFAVLYDTNQIHPVKNPDPNWFKYEIIPVKYLPLIKNAGTDFNYDSTWPMTTDYVRDEAIDTSPSAHILAMAMNGANGILVYKYNPNTQTLTNIWSPQVFWWKEWF